MGSLRIIGIAAIIAGIVGLALGALMEASCYGGVTGFCNLFFNPPSAAGSVMASVLTAGLLWGPLILILGIVLLLIPARRATFSS